MRDKADMIRQIATDIGSSAQSPTALNRITVNEPIERLVDYRIDVVDAIIAEHVHELDESSADYTNNGWCYYTHSFIWNTSACFSLDLALSYDHQHHHKQHDNLSNT